ncbi:uncharacterized protein B0I36DRAFT_402654, partial [Microdochium trichocladiopsis]
AARVGSYHSPYTCFFWTSTATTPCRSQGKRIDDGGLIFCNLNPLLVFLTTLLNNGMHKAFHWSLFGRGFHPLAGDTSSGNRLFLSPQLLLQNMAIYHISVRDYFWPAGNVMVQCPARNLSATSSPPIIRPLAGVNKGEPRFLDSAGSLEDRHDSRPYLTEAHGVLVPADSALDRVPIWVPFRQQPARQNDPPVKKHDRTPLQATPVETLLAADLTTSTQLQVPMDQICWVPTREASDGRICTIIASQLTVGRKNMSHVLLQSIESPASAKFALLSTQELSEFSEIDNNRKQQLFEVHLMMVLRGKRSLSPPLKNALRLVLCSHPRAAAKRLFWDALDDTTKTSKYLGSETSDDTFWDELDSDHESVFNSPGSSVAVAPSLVSIGP